MNGLHQIDARDNEIYVKPVISTGAYAGCFGILTTRATEELALAAIQKMAEALRASGELPAIAGYGTSVAALTLLSQLGILPPNVESLIPIGAIAMGGVFGASGSELGIAAGVKIGAVTGVAGVITGLGMNWLLNRNAVTPINQKNIAIGMWMGATAGMLSAQWLPSIAIPVTGIIAGAVAGARVYNNSNEDHIPLFMISQVEDGAA